MDPRPSACGGAIVLSTYVPSPAEGWGGASGYMGETGRD